MTCESRAPLHASQLTDVCVRAFTADPSTVSSSFAKRAPSSTRSSASATGSQFPITTSLSGEEPVFRIGYPQGSYSGSTGGTQFYSQALNTSGSGQNYERMLLSYDVWFPTGYAYVLDPTTQRGQAGLTGDV